MLEPAAPWQEVQLHVSCCQHTFLTADARRAEGAQAAQLSYCAWAHLPIFGRHAGLALHALLFYSAALGSVSDREVAGVSLSESWTPWGSAKVAAMLCCASNL